MNLTPTYFLLAFILKTCSCVIVQTQNGPVEGRIRTSDLGKDYFSFQGIPYARAAVGVLKFRDSQPPEPWIEPLNCTVEGPNFWGVDLMTGEFTGSFDSLHVNVYSNSITPDTLYPVMVYIHGGSYMGGSSSIQTHGPDFLVEKNVTIVTINYRLGVYGFLSLNDSTLNVPGNAGLKDQRLALRWVQQNIANFGGDPNRVTLFGHSAGGGSTHYHMLSESSRGLFHRGIAMGSNALQNIGRIFPSGQWAQILAQRLGFEGNSTTDLEILEFLELADPVDVVLQTLLLVSIDDIISGTFFAFGPTLEPYDTEGVFINANVFDLIENTWSDEIPFMIGQVSFESLGFIPLLRSAPEFFDFFANFETHIPSELGVEKNTKKSQEYAAMIRQVYYPVFEPTITNIDGLLYMWSDNDLWFPTQLITRYRLRAGNKAPTFIYRFDADTEYNVGRQIIPGVDLYRHPSHGDDAAHLFNSVRHKNFAEVNEETRNTVEVMTSSFANFAAFGDPSVPELGIYWPPVSSENELLMGLNIHETESEVMEFPESKRMHVFTEIWDTERGENSDGTVFQI